LPLPKPGDVVEVGDLFGTRGGWLVPAYLR
jgi:hypothetical protein